MGPEIPVGICLEPSSEMVVGLLGMLKAGGVYLPMDPTYPKERLASWWKRLKLPVIITHQRLASALPEYAGTVVCLDTDLDAITREGEENPNR